MLYMEFRAGGSTLTEEGYRRPVCPPDRARRVARLATSILMKATSAAHAGRASPSGCEGLALGGSKASALAGYAAWRFIVRRWFSVVPAHTPSSSWSSAHARH